MTWQIHYQEAEKNILATHAEYNNAYNGSKLNDISNGILIVISYSFHSFIPINSLDVKRQYGDMKDRAGKAQIVPCKAADLGDNEFLEIITRITPIPRNDYNSPAYLDKLCNK